MSLSFSCSTPRSPDNCIQVLPSLNVYFMTSHHKTPSRTRLSDLEFSWLGFALWLHFKSSQH
jgi:hypothetical protein